MKVVILTEQQKDQLFDQMVTDTWYYSVYQDADDNWVTSANERDGTVKPEFMWIKDLPSVELKQKPYVSPYPSGSSY
jgi:hypothetical protein